MDFVALIPLSPDGLATQDLCSLLDEHTCSEECSTSYPNLSFVLLTKLTRTLLELEMTGRVHLVRHIGGLHNLLDDTDIPNAPLSERGFDYLGRRFIQANSNRTDALICSPLRRVSRAGIGSAGGT